jgi:hypothetical protein
MTIARLKEVVKDAVRVRPHDQLRAFRINADKLSKQALFLNNANLLARCIALKAFIAEEIASCGEKAKPKAPAALCKRTTDIAVRNIAPPAPSPLSVWFNALVFACSQKIVADLASQRLCTVSLHCSAQCF